MPALCPRTRSKGFRIFPQSQTREANLAAKLISSSMKLDKFDFAILACLQQDARISLQELSSQVGLTSSPCWARIKRMEEAGVIEGYAVRLNAAKIGLADTVIVQVTLDNHSDEALFEFGRALEQI